MKKGTKYQLGDTVYYVAAHGIFKGKVVKIDIVEDKKNDLCMDLGVWLDVVRP